MSKEDVDKIARIEEENGSVVIRLRDRIEIFSKGRHVGTAHVFRPMRDEPSLCAVCTKDFF